MSLNKIEQARNNFVLANESFKAYRETQNIEKGKEAKELYEAALVLDNCSSVHNNLGVLYCELGYYHDSIVQYEQIQEKTPDTWYNIAVASYWSGQYQSAMKALGHLNQEDKCFPDGLAMKGKIFIELNEYTEASQAFTEAFALKNDVKYLIWDGYACYLNAELLPDKETANKNEYKKRLTTVIRKLEKAKSIAFKSEEKDYYSATLLFLGCFYTRHDDILSGKENLIECSENSTCPKLKSKAEELLGYSWNRGIRPSWWNWWTKSPKALKGRFKRRIFKILVFLIGGLSSLILLHPILEGQTGFSFNWNLYLFLIGLITLILVSPSAERIKTGQIEVELIVPQQLEGVPAPAKLEDALRGLKTKSKKKVSHM